ncbi:hypothetical protein JJJ10_22250 [Klebsiella grimontii]|uniref:hypothetical protein n=1 Tax=Klebsiella grimontii TaxID=2058152 RepID=UPI000E34A2C7|nr:hypothetical protein [Klebsiella grimontii]RFP41657.1 hypothetical protein DDJ34_20445 [Klebsiella oxytoca]MBZ6971715.1 hypothetical protein [Klebsiella grimontii]MBZ7826284.1 hypothetical protein [Klebsiella grimontii]MDM4405835.1 hypothetical protein [Klebsiella grimontii]QTP39137.1 hypothetical protein JJJ10_22250 [Klebsiella grimontii]
MSLSNLLKDTVSLLKKNGERVDNIKASVQSKKIFINRSDILIETGDLIQRRMSNGGEETYEVIDPGFHERHGAIAAGYQMTHKKLGLPEVDKAIQNITYNISGANSRVNNHSIDNSINITSFNSNVAEHIAMLRSEIEQFISKPEEKKEALEIVDAIDGQFSSDKPSKVIVKSLLASLPTIGNIATIGSFLLSCFGG